MKRQAYRATEHDCACKWTMLAYSVEDDTAKRWGSYVPYRMSMFPLLANATSNLEIIIMGQASI